MVQTRSISKTFGLLLFRPLRGHLPHMGKALGGANLTLKGKALGAAQPKAPHQGEGLDLGKNRKSLRFAKKIYFREKCGGNCDKSVVYCYLVRDGFHFLMLQFF